MYISDAGLSSLGVPGVPWHTQILADQLTLFQPGGTDYAHLITTGTPGFSDLPTALQKYHLIWLPILILSGNPMNVYVTELEKWVESGLSTFEIRRLVAEIYFRMTELRFDRYSTNF